MELVVGALDFSEGHRSVIICDHHEIGKLNPLAPIAESM